MKTSYVLFCSLVLSSALHATVSFNLQADLLKNSGGTGIADNSLVLLVASTNDGSFGSITPGSSTSVGSLLNTDDAIVFKTGMNGNSLYGTNGVLDISTGSLNLASVSGWSTGDPLALLWFPTLTSSATTIPAGTPYGFYTNASAVDGSIAWITPSDPSSAKPLAFFTKDGGDLSPGSSASNLATAGNASQTVVAAPEPSRALLGAMGLGAFLMRRRRAA